MDSVTIRGYRFSTGWAKNQKVFFYAQFSKPFEKFTSQGPYSRMDFQTTEGEQIMVKVAISPTSMDGAQANMEEELAGWDFNGTVKSATKAWNAELSKIKIDTDDEDARTVFYTSLYHTMIQPSDPHRKRLRELHHFLALGHLQGCDAADDDYPS